MTTDISRIRRIAEWLRAALLSPEAVWIVSVIATSLLCPAPLSDVGSVVDLSDWVVVSSGAVAAVGLILATTVHMRRITQVGKAGREILRAWPNYWILSLRVRLGFLFSLMGGGAVITGVFAGPTAGGPEWALVLFLGGLGLQVVTLITMAYAAWRISEVLDGL